MEYTIEHLDAEALGHDEKMEPTQAQRVFVDSKSGNVMIVGRSKAVKITLKASE